MRLSVIILLLFSSVLLAETQAELYYKAMQLEEQGDVSGSLALFEQAYKAGGEYTEEIKEIIDSYREALDIKGENGEENSLEFSLLGDASVSGLHYAENGYSGNLSENGADIFVSLGAFLDWSVGDWLHSFGLAFVSEWFLSDREESILDSNTWSIAPGLEYSLIGKNLLVDVGVDFNIGGDTGFRPSVFSLAEYSFARFDKQRVGVSFWAYDRFGGPLSFALHAAWHRTAVEGFNAAVFVGVKYEADSLSDVLGYVESLDEDCVRDVFGQCVDVGNNGNGNGNGNGNNGNGNNGYQNDITYYWNKCVAENSIELCADAGNGLLQSYVEDGMNGGDGVKLERAWSRWLGPVVKSRVSYVFHNKMTLQAKLNLFYGFVLDGASSEYEKLRKFTGSWGLTYSWKPNIFTFYAGVEQIYLRYSLPGKLKEYFPKSSLLTEAKLGVKFEI